MKSGLAIITGVNRSGTSFVTSAAQALGANLGSPSSLLGADFRNVRGYFENVEVLELNLRMVLGDWINIRWWLDEIEGTKLRPTARLGLLAAKALYFAPFRRLTERRAERLAPKLSAFVAAHPTMLVKDSRFCSTLRLWARYGGVSRVLFVLRHPAEVVASLNSAYGLPRALGYHYWCQEVEQFFHQAEGLPTVIVDYGALCNLQTLAAESLRLWRFVATDADPAAALSTIGEVVGPELRHHAASDETKLPPRVMQLYTELLRHHARYAELSRFAR